MAGAGTKKKKYIIEEISQIERRMCERQPDPRGA